MFALKYESSARNRSDNADCSKHWIFHQLKKGRLTAEMKTGS